MDIVDDLRDLNSMHTPNEVSGIADEAADEIERLREQCEFEKKCRNDAFEELKQRDADIERLREESQKQREKIMLLNSMVQTEHVIIKQKDSE